jgi:hypothetical protein
LSDYVQNAIRQDAWQALGQQEAAHPAAPNGEKEAA